MKDPQQRKFFNTDMLTSTAMMRRMKRPALEAPYKKPVTPERPARREAHPEFHMPDEDRSFWLKAKRCPHCGYHASMQRMVIDGKPMYRVRCQRIESCGNATEFFRFYKDAFRHWQMLAILAGE